MWRWVIFTRVNFMCENVWKIKDWVNEMKMKSKKSFSFWDRAGKWEKWWKVLCEQKNENEETFCANSRETAKLSDEENLRKALVKTQFSADNNKCENEEENSWNKFTIFMIVLVWIMIVKLIFENWWWLWLKLDIPNVWDVICDISNIFLYWLQKFEFV